MNLSRCLAKLISKRVRIPAKMLSCYLIEYFQNLRRGWIGILVGIEFDYVGLFRLKARLITLYQFDIFTKITHKSTRIADQNSFKLYLAYTNSVILSEGKNDKRHTSQIIS
jgi:histidinol phosphatase-like PHP family hydrolase